MPGAAWGAGPGAGDGAGPGGRHGQCRRRLLVGQGRAQPGAGRHGIAARSGGMRGAGQPGAGQLRRRDRGLPGRLGRPGAAEGTGRERCGRGRVMEKGSRG
ncbi:hypothetical protein MTBUT4_150038 [Magnetospirillum sp. UT-4]|nr:hypothetical protein MTBUT4_150038 [Magnetospirillum sp. UT-4]